jgi:hypothetical protein
MSKNSVITHGWIALWLALLIISLFCRPLLPVDETRYLSVAWEMWQSHQFLVPHINGLPYSHKPPLLFWLIQAGWGLLGVNAWSARLTAPMFSLFSIFFAIHLARMLWPNRLQLHQNVPYLVLGTCFWSIYSTLTLFDMLLACFSLMAWIGMLIVQKNKRRLGWGLYAAAAGLGILAKGPIMLVYIVPPALLEPWWACRAQSVSWRRWYGGFFLAITAGAALALAWAIPAAKAGGEQYAQAIFLGQAAGRMVNSFAHQRPFYWYLLLTPLLFFPWSFSRPIWSGLRRLHLSPATRFCLSILVPGFLALSAISGKQIHYLLPLLPPAVLLIARASCEESEEIAGKAGSSRVLPLILALLALSLWVAPIVPLRGGDSGMLAYVPPWLGLGPLFIALVLFFDKAEQKNSIVRTATALMLVLIYLHLALAQSLHKLYDATAISDSVQQAQAAGKEVAVFPARLSDQFQFAGRLTVPLVPQQTLEDVILWSGQHQEQNVLLFLNSKEYSKFTFSEGSVMQPYRDSLIIFSYAKDVYFSSVR